MSLVKLEKMDQQKARHKINHPVEKGHGVGTIVENVIEVFLPGQVPISEFSLIYTITLLALLRIEQILKVFKPQCGGKISHPHFSNIIYGFHSQLMKGTFFIKRKQMRW